MTDESSDIGEQQPLSPAERRILLRLARESIAANIERRSPPVLADPTDALLRPSGAFVTLLQSGQLRGCIGTVQPQQPLWIAVVRMAAAAAFDDPRFPPLQAEELAHTQIEISRLSPLRRGLPEDVVPGRHGVCIARGDRRGVLLPQVATTYGWDRETFLSQCCLKAGLPLDAWRDPDTALLLFEAEVFAEEPGSEVDGACG